MVSTKPPQRTKRMIRSLKSLSIRVKSLREEMGWTQEYLANEITRRFSQYGVDARQSHIGNIESLTSVKLPSVPMLVALAMTLDASTDYLCGLTDDQSPPEPRFLNESEKAVENIMPQLSPSNQRRMALMAQSFLEEEQAPSTDKLIHAIETALELVEALGGDESVMRLIDGLESDAPSVARRLSIRRHSVDES